MTPFPRINGALHIGGHPVAKVASRVGSTPFYAYDRAAMTSRVAMLRSCLPKEIAIHYAMKANPMPAVVHHLAGLVDGIDVASHGEMLVALDTGIAPHAISFAGPGKSTKEIECAVAAGIVLNIESGHELEKVVAAGRKLYCSPRVAIRINPDFELKGSGMRMGGGPKPFGVDIENVPGLLEAIEKESLSFEGFHIFAGSQNLSAEAIIQAQKNTLRLVYQLSHQTKLPIRKVNIGGGFGIPYFAGDTALDVASIGNHLKESLQEFAQHLPEATMVLELGRYLVGEAGIYVCRVTDRKVSRGHVFLVVDGGMHHHLAASGNLGQVIRKNYPVVAAHEGNDRVESVSVVGPLCTPLDLLADKVLLPRLEIGDLVVVLQSGAYGITASPNRFLNHPAAEEVLV